MVKSAADISLLFALHETVVLYVVTSLRDIVPTPFIIGSITTPTFVINAIRIGMAFSDVTSVSKSKEEIVLPKKSTRSVAEALTI